MTYFRDLLLFLDAIGVQRILLPFLLVFTIVYAVFARTKILGEKSKRFNVIIAFVMGMAVVTPHVIMGTPSTTDAVLTNGLTDVVEVINNSLPSVSIMIVAIIMLVLVLGTFGIRWKLEDSGAGSIIIIAAVIIITYIFGTSAGWFMNGQFPNFLQFLDDPFTQSLLVTFLAFVVIIWLITREDKEDGGGENNNFFNTLQKGFEAQKT